MFKIIGGDFPTTSAYSSGLLTWGFGKDKSLKIENQISKIELIKIEPQFLEFKCTFKDARTLSVKSDRKSFENFNKYAGANGISPEQIRQLFGSEQVHNKKWYQSKRFKIVAVSVIAVRPQKILCKSELSTSLQTKLKKEEKV